MDRDPEAQFRATERPSPFVSTHASISTGRPVEEIHAIAAAEGWWPMRLSRGPFEVVEFWIENHVMLELMTPEMECDCLAAVPSAGRCREATDAE